MLIISYIYSKYSILYIGFSYWHGEWIGNSVLLKLLGATMGDVLSSELMVAEFIDEQMSHPASVSDDANRMFVKYYSTWISNYLSCVNGKIF